jgi:hypothetical protein
VLTWLPKRTQSRIFCATCNPALSSALSTNLVSGNLGAVFNMFGYGFTRGLDKMKDDTKFIIIAAQQPDESYYDYFIPMASLKALVSGSIQMADFEKEAYVATGSAVND